MSTARRVAAVCAVLLFLGPDLLISTSAQVPDLPTTDAGAIAFVFSEDGAASLPASASDIDRLSTMDHFFPLADGSIVHILAVGAQRPARAPVGGLFVDPGFDRSTSRRFTTMSAADASIAPHSATATDVASLAPSDILVICQEWTANGKLPCAPTLTVSGRVGAGPLSSLSTWSAANADRVGAGTPSLDPTQGPSIYASDLTLAGVATAATRSLGLVWGPLEGSNATALGTYTVYAVPIPAMPYDVTLNTPALALGEVSIQDTTSHAAIGSLREPLWRRDAPNLQRLQYCSALYPGAALLSRALTTPVDPVASATVHAWDASCSNVTNAHVRVGWSDLLADPAFAIAMRGSALTGGSTIANAFSAYTADHITEGLVPGCPPIISLCLRRLVLSALHSGPQVSIRVEDQGNWTNGSDPQKIFGGHVLANVTLGAYLDLGGDQTGFAQPTAGPLTLEIEVVPAPPSFGSTDVAIARPGGDVLAGFAHAEPSDPELAPGEGPSTVPLVALSGLDPSARFSDYMIPISTPADGAVSALQTCVENAFSYDARGPDPNFDLPDGSQASRLALSSVEGTAACIPLQDLLTLSLPTLSIGTLLEVRTGATYDITIEVGHLQPVNAAEDWVSGDNGAGEWRVGATTLATTPPPWNSSNPLYSHFDTRGNASMPRITITLPYYLPKEALASTSVLLSYLLRPILGASFVEIPDLPETPVVDHLLMLLDKASTKADVPPLPLLIPAGSLQLSALDLPMAAKLMSVHGLAASPRFITIGSGDVTHGAYAWSRLGPSPRLEPKPDFIAPAPLVATAGGAEDIAGEAAFSVMNAVPLVELLELSGLRGVDTIRAGLAALALPVQRTDPPPTFYEEGYGVLDITPFLDGITPARPDLSAIQAMVAKRIVPSTPPRASSDVTIWPTTIDRSLGVSLGLAHGDLYVIGGASANGPISDHVDRVDRVTKQLVPSGTLLPAPREYARTFSTAAEMYVVAGIYKSGSYTLSGDAVTRVAPASARASDIAHVSLYGPGVAVAFDGVHTGYAVGGANAPTAIRKIDIGTGMVTQIGSMPIPISDATAVWANGAVYVFGGQSNNAILASIYRIDPSTGHATLVKSLPSGSAGASAVFDRSAVYILGGYTAISGGHWASPTDRVLRFDPVTNAIDTMPQRLPAPSPVPSALFDGNDIIFFADDAQGQGVIASFTPPTPTYADPLMAPLQDPSTDPSTIMGASMPVGLLDGIALGASVQLRLDIPLLPGTLVADWGTTDHARQHPSNITLLDVGAALNESFHAELPDVRDIMNVTTVTSGLVPGLDPKAILAFVKEHDVELKTEHYSLFDLLSTDYLYGAEAALLREAATMQPPDPNAPDPVQEVLDPVKAVLPTPHHLTEDMRASLYANATVGAHPRCLDLTQMYEYLQSVGKLADKMQAGYVSAASGAGVSMGSAGEFATAQATENFAAQDAKTKLCSLTSTYWLVKYAESLRRVISALRDERLALQAVQALPDEAAGLAPQDVQAILRETAQATGAHDIAMDTTSDGIALYTILDDELVAAIEQLEDLLVRLGSTRHMHTEQPYRLDMSIPEETETAPLGPYVGITMITDHDVKIVDPLNGRIIAWKNITIPIPSLLFNDPELDARLQYRDGMADPHASLTLHDMAFHVFDSVTVDPVVTLPDGVKVPLFNGQLPAQDPPVRLPIEFPSQLGEVSQRINDSIARLTSSKNLNNTTAAEATGLALARDALLHLPLGTTGVGLDALLVGLYAHPKMVGTGSDGDGNARIGNLFPATQAERYQPYLYGAAHDLRFDYPYASPIPGDAQPTIADTGNTLANFLMDAVTGQDASHAPGEMEHFNHLPGAPSSVPAAERKLYASDVFEIHGDAVGPYHQFGLTVGAGLDPAPVVCMLFHSENDLLDVDLASPLPCPERNVDLPKLPDIEQQLCSRFNDVVACLQGMQDLVEGSIAKCAQDIGDLPSCEVLSDALDAVASILGQIGLPVPDLVPMPFVLGAHHSLLMNADKIGLDKDHLTDAILAANGWTADRRTDAADEAEWVLANLPRVVSLAFRVHEPPREKHENYNVAQGLMEHATDKVQGTEWTAFSVPPPVGDIVNMTRDVLVNASTRLIDPTVQAFANTSRDALTQLAATDPVKAQAALSAPTLADVAAAHNGTTTNASLWLPDDGIHGVRLGGAPSPISVNVSLQDAEATFNLSVGVKIGGAGPSDTIALDLTPLAPSANWSRNISAANVVRHAFDAGETPLQAARDAATVVSDATSWQFDRANDSIRANTTLQTPKIGVMTYSVPLPPEEWMQVRTDGEYYFQNSDGILIVTPDDLIRDSVLTLAGNLSSVLGAEAPALRAQTLMKDLDQALVSLPHGMIRVQHLNPAVRVEHLSDTMDGSVVRSDELLVRVGGLRTKSAGNMYEFIPGHDAALTRYTELHFVYLIFPLVDSTNVADVVSAATVTDPLGVTSTTAQDFIAGEGSEFILRNFSVMWDTYLGIAPSQPGAFSVHFPVPWRDNVEEAKLYYAIPGDGWPNADQFHAEGRGGVTLDPTDIRYAQNAPFVRGSRTWITMCGDTYGAGMWYTPSGFEPRGIAALSSARRVWSDHGLCKKNDVTGLLPHKETFGEVRPEHFAYSVPDKIFLAGFQYDINTELTQWDQNAHVEKDLLPEDTDTILLHPASIAALLLADVGLAGDAGDAVSAAGNSAEDLATTGLGAAQEVVNEAIGLGVLDDLEPQTSYVPTSDYASGAGATLHEWVVLDERALEKLSPVGRGSITLSDSVPYVEDKPYASPPHDLEQEWSFTPAPTPTIVVDVDPALPTMSDVQAAETKAGTHADTNLDGLADTLDAYLADHPTSTHVPLLASFDDLAAASDAASSLESLGFRVKHVFHAFPVIAFSGPAALVRTAVGIDGLRALDLDTVMSATAPVDNQTVIRAPEARTSNGVTGAGVSIAILDTGVDTKHEAIPPEKIVGWADAVNLKKTPYDDHGHGTHVASIAAGKGIGVAPDATLVVTKVLNDQGSGWTSDILAGVEYSNDTRDRYNTSAISMSLGGIGRGDGTSPAEIALTTVVDYGLPIVIAVGNSGPTWLGFPASARDVIAVGSVKNDGSASSFSSWGPTKDGRMKPEVVAPGESVVAAKAGTSNGYVAMSGTSMATPFVSGTVALARSHDHFESDALRVRQALMDTARDVGAPGGDNVTGAGVVDAVGALAALPPAVKNIRLSTVHWAAAARPGAWMNLTVALRNTGTTTETNVVVTGKRDGANDITRTVATLAPGALVLLEYDWLLPDAEDWHTFDVATPVLAGEDHIDDNALGVTARATRLERAMGDQVWRFGERFDPGRTVVGMKLEVVAANDPSNDMSAYEIQLSAAMFDGFTGTGFGAVAQLVAVLSAASKWQDPLYNKFGATAGITGYLAQASGGTALGLDPPDSARTLPVPSLACWHTPLATLMLFMGECHGAVGQIYQAEVGAVLVTGTCGLSLPNLMGSTNSLMTSLGQKTPFGGTAVQPSYDALFSPASHVGTDALAGILAGQAGLLGSKLPIFIPCAGGQAGASTWGFPDIGDPMPNTPSFQACAAGSTACMTETSEDLAPSHMLRVLPTNITLDLPIPVGMPRNLTAAPGPTVNAVKLQWVPPIGVVTSYRIYRSSSTTPLAPDPSSYALIATIGPNASYVDSGLAQGMQYYYEVVADRRGNDSAVAGPANSRAAGVPSAPVAPSYTPNAISHDTLVRWTASSDDGGASPLYYEVHASWCRNTLCARTTGTTATLSSDGTATYSIMAVAPWASSARATATRIG